MKEEDKNWKKVSDEEFAYLRAGLSISTSEYLKRCAEITKEVITDFESVKEVK